jgi:hypothetical protein
MIHIAMIKLATTWRFLHKASQPNQFALDARLAGCISHCVARLLTDLGERSTSTDWPTQGVTGVLPAAALAITMYYVSNCLWLVTMQVCFSLLSVVGWFLCQNQGKPAYFCSIPVWWVLKPQWERRVVEHAQRVCAIIAGPIECFVRAAMDLRQPSPCMYQAANIVAGRG